MERYFDEAEFKKIGQEFIEEHGLRAMDCDRLLTFLAQHERDEEIRLLHTMVAGEDHFRAALFMKLFVPLLVAQVLVDRGEEPNQPLFDFLAPRLEEGIRIEREGLYGEHRGSE